MHALGLISTSFVSVKVSESQQTNLPIDTVALRVDGLDSLVQSAAVRSASFDVISPRENIPTIKISPLVLRIALCNLRSIALRFGVCFIDRIENWILIHQSLNDIQPKRSIHPSHARVALPLIFWHSISTRQSNIYTVGRLLDFLRAWLGIVGRF